MNLFDLIKQGGWAMWPLGACSLIMLYLIINCWRQTQEKQFVQNNALNLWFHYFTTMNIADIAAMLPQTTVLNRSMLTVVNKLISSHATASRDDIETVFTENIEHEDNNLSQWILYLNVIATVSPMIGLLGTVSGMIGAFQTISSGGMGRPELLAGDIGEALITTATGLIIGIPAMVFYFILKNRLNNRMLATAQVGDQIIDHIFTPSHPENQSS